MKITLLQKANRSSENSCKYFSLEFFLKSVLFSSIPHSKFKTVFPVKWKPDILRRISLSPKSTAGFSLQSQKNALPPSCADKHVLF